MCQRSGWIDNTTVTVDVTGRWIGTWNDTWGASWLDMSLQQPGPKATGNDMLTCRNAPPFGGPIEGTVSGDVLKFNRPGGQLRGEVIVAGDAMSGTVTFGTDGTKTLRLQREPGGPPPESR